MSISARLAKRVDDVRASYWFVPSLLVLAAIALSQITVLLDQNPDRIPEIVDRISLITSEDGARAVVSVIAQSMIGVAGVLFSVTMLAVSYASGQFGPRLIGNFMRDHGNQWSLGILIATFTYALLVLRAIANPADGIDAIVPHLSVVVAMAMALASVFVVIYHVHHVPETISVSNIIAGLGNRFVNDVETLTENAPNPALPGRGDFVDVTMRTTGYVHNIATEQLGKLCRTKGWTLGLLAEPGDFVHPHKPMMRVWGPANLDQEQLEDLRQTVALGDAKTEHQNVLFVAEQLVEIVARAMSPGVNDPFTAVTVMQWLEAGLSGMVQQQDGLTVITAPEVVSPKITFDRLLQKSLGDCAPYAQNDPITRQVMLELLESLERRAAPANRDAIVALLERIKSAV